MLKLFYWAPCICLGFDLERGCVWSVWRVWLRSRQTVVSRGRCFWRDGHCGTKILKCCPLKLAAFCETCLMLQTANCPRDSIVGKSSAIQEFLLVWPKTRIFLRFLSCTLSSTLHRIGFCSVIVQCDVTNVFWDTQTSWRLRPTNFLQLAKNWLDIKQITIVHVSTLWGPFQRLSIASGPNVTILSTGCHTRCSTWFWFEKVSMSYPTWLYMYVCDELPQVIFGVCTALMETCMFRGWQGNMMCTIKYIVAYLRRDHAWIPPVIHSK